MNFEDNSKRKRVVVTGLGAVCPVGNNIADMWAALVAGKSGIDYITSFDTTDFETRIAGEVKGFDASLYVSRKQVQRMDRFTQFAVAASLQAVQSARLTINESNALDTGVIIGNSVCGLLSVCEEIKVLTEKGPARVSPILAPSLPAIRAIVPHTALHPPMGWKTPYLYSMKARIENRPGQVKGDIPRYLDWNEKVSRMRGSEKNFFR